MKKIILSIILIITFSTSFSQDKIPVTIIKNDGTKLKCNISTYNGKIISGFTFKIWINEKKIKINRSEIKEIITHNSKYINIEYLKKTRRGGQITTKKVRRTAELLSDKEVKLCAVHTVQTSVDTFNGITTPTGTFLITYHYLVSDETSFIKKTNFKKIIKKHFPDCKELNSKIKSKELKFIQIQEAVSIGNQCI